MQKINFNKKNFKHYIPIFIIILYGIFLVIFSISDIPKSFNRIFFSGSLMPFLYDKPLYDDSFYGFQVAKNIASGKGITDNFGNYITGVQILTTIIQAGIIYFLNFLNNCQFILIKFCTEKIVTDQLLINFFLKTIILINIGLLIYFCHLLGKIAIIIFGNGNQNYNKNLYFLSILISCTSFYIFRLFTSGYETSLYLVLISLFLLSYIRIIKKKSFFFIEYCWLGFIIGFAGLTRIDFGFFYFLFLIFIFHYRKNFFKFFLLSGLIGFLVVLPWLIFVYSVSDSFLPSSGHQTLSLIKNHSEFIYRFKFFFSSVLQNLIPTFFSGHGLLWPVNFINFLILFFIAYFIFKNKLYFKNIIKNKIIFIREFLLSIVFLSLFYFLFSKAIVYYSRYLSILLIFSIPFLANLLCKIIEKKIINNLYKKTVVILITFFFISSIYSFHSSRMYTSLGVTAGAILNNYPNNKIGVWNSGMINFINKNVINLDGRLNIEVMSHYKKFGNIDNYLIKHNEIDMLIDWEWVFKEHYLSRNYFYSNFYLCGQIEKAKPDIVEVYCRKK
jgi:hypothetical protein